MGHGQMPVFVGGGGGFRNPDALWCVGSARVIYYTCMYPLIIYYMCTFLSTH